MFLLEFKPDIFENIRNQRPEEAGTSTGLLNTLNLNRRSACLESILVRPFFNFHHQIQKNLRSLELQTLNAKQNLSTKEGSPSTFEIFFSSILSVESRLFFVELNVSVYCLRFLMKMMSMIIVDPFSMTETITVPTSKLVSKSASTQEYPVNLIL